MPAGRTGDEQGFSLGGSQMEKLRKERAKRAAGHDDRTFRAKRTAGADRNRRRDRFEQCHFGFDQTAAQQDCFQRFRDPVPRIFSDP